MMRQTHRSQLRVAIIGAGFCGLAAAWHLLNHHPRLTRLSVQVFDSKPIGQSTSGMAAGLLHPYVGARSKLNWQGHEGVRATRNLLQVAAAALKKPVISEQAGILRLALSAEQQRDFQRCAQLHPEETVWLEASACQALVPQSAWAPGLWITAGWSVDAHAYLLGLWEACKQQGAHFEQRTIVSLKETERFDITIIAAGADSAALPELAALPLKKVKGQILEFAWPKSYPPLRCALNSQVYMVMNAAQTSCFAGATYEKTFLTAGVDPETATRLLLPKIYTLFPPLKQAALLNCYAGVRAVAPQHRPLLERVSSSAWLITGMGSKGLLYHALFAQALAKHLLAQAVSTPIDFFRN